MVTLPPYTCCKNGEKKSGNESYWKMFSTAAFPSCGGKGLCLKNAAINCMGIFSQYQQDFQKVLQPEQ
jgi:hypothetical protein